MRIAIVSAFGHVVGGCETYLQSLIPALAERGHTVAYWHESAVAPGTRAVAPDRAVSWCVEELGLRPALAALRAWRPDLIYGHGLADPAHERATMAIAPAVKFLHGYAGACISGTRLWKHPLRPCARAFGFGCLLAYYPRRCGGWNPWTMWNEFSRQRERMKLLFQYRILLTHSDHMISVFRRQRVPAERLMKIPFPAQALLPSPWRHSGVNTAVYRLLFAGRCDFTKGGTLLLEALSQCAPQLEKPVELTIAGAGADQPRWERKARQLMGASPGLKIVFEGWVSPERLQALAQSIDALIFPSVWPEPFGLAGAEAALAGIPVAAFDVGGVREWIQRGARGVLAPGDPPTATGLAKAIMEVLRGVPSADQWPPQMPARFEMKSHLDALEAIFKFVGRPGG